MGGKGGTAVGGVRCWGVGGDRQGERGCSLVVGATPVGGSSRYDPFICSVAGDSGRLVGRGVRGPAGITCTCMCAFDWMGIGGAGKLVISSAPCCPISGHEGTGRG